MVVVSSTTPLLEVSTTLVPEIVIAAPPTLSDSTRLKARLTPLPPVPPSEPAPTPVMPMLPLPLMRTVENAIATPALLLVPLPPVPTMETLPLPVLSTTRLLTASTPAKLTPWLFWPLALPPVPLMLRVPFTVVTETPLPQMRTPSLKSAVLPALPPPMPVIEMAPLPLACTLVPLPCRLTPMLSLPLLLAPLPISEMLPVPELSVAELSVMPTPALAASPVATPVTVPVSVVSRPPRVMLPPLVVKAMPVPLTPLSAM